MAIGKSGVVRGSTAPALEPLEPNKKYIRKMEYLARKREIAAAEERRHNKRLRMSDKKRKQAGEVAPASKRKKSKDTNAVKAVVPKEKGSKTVRTSAKKSSRASAKVKLAPKTSARKHVKSAKAGKKVTHKLEDPCPPFALPPPSQEEVDKQLLRRVIGGDDAKRDCIGNGAPSGGSGLNSPHLPFLDDYTQQKRSEVVEADELLAKAHSYFKDLGKKESQLRRAAAKRLRELKEINKRGGDKDGFRYVVPRSVKEVVRQMTQCGGVDPSQLVSTFGAEDERAQQGGSNPYEASDCPRRRRKRKNLCYTDFYQFQVSQRWTRNAERFLEKGRAHKSMFEASKQKRSLKKF